MARSQGVREGSPSRSSIDIALVVPLDGPAGIYGPSCEACAQLAVEELNIGLGLLGREVRLVVVDGSRSPDAVASEVGALIDAGVVDAVTGWHISPVRRAIARRTRGLVPYVYAPLHEGEERTPGVFMTGETPASQLVPAMDWMKAQFGVERWAVVGNDYVWPRSTGRSARLHAIRRGSPLVDEIYVPLGTEDFSETVRRIDNSGADGVLMLLVGNDGVEFNRQFALSGMSMSLPRLSPHVEENMLIAGGAEANRGLYSAAGYFEALNTTESMEFAGRYYASFGPDAPPLNSIGESCYEAMSLLIQLTRRARSLDVDAMIAACDGLEYEGPRGRVRMRGHQLSQRIYVAEASELDFDVRDRIDAV